MNMVGYPLVLPDMIGGNGYGETPTKELFIRWLQANVFMPSLQYSYAPWDFDDEVSFPHFLLLAHQLMNSGIKTYGIGVEGNGNE
jgi:alpha-glucosidase (family GH31 glycosyl hydrolase)